MDERWSRFRAWIAGRRGLAEDLAEEIESHVDMEAARLVERGMAPEQARAEARRRFGNRTRVAERARDAWGFPGLEGLLKDIRYGLRGIRRAPGFAAVVILTLALGIGLNTAIYSVVRAVLLRPLPYPDSERLVVFGESFGRSGMVSVTWVNFKYWRDGNHTFESMAARQFSSLTLTGRGEPQQVRGLVVTPPYFDLLGMHPQLGRLFDARDDRADAAPVVVLNHRFWAGRLGADPSIVGTSLTLNGTLFEIAGVAAPQWEPFQVDYYLPLGRQNAGLENRAQHGPIRIIGRLKPGVTVAAARADLDAIMRHLAEVDPGPENGHLSAGVLWIEDIAGDARGTLVMLIGAAGLILLIACANVAGLLLARNSARASELAVRRAIGAGRFRLARQLFAENVTLAGAGGLAGIGLAYAAVRALVTIGPRGIPRLEAAGLDSSVLLFACAVTLATALIAGAAPVFAAGSANLTAALKEGARLSGTGRERQRMRNLLVAGEVALTFMLAFGSGLLVRSLIAARNANPGYDPRRALSFSLQLPMARYKTPEAADEFFSRLLSGLRALPGATEAAAVFCGPGAGDCGDWWYSVPGRPVPARNEVPLALTNSAEPGYFHMMRIPILEGREFRESDRTGPAAVVVNQRLARQWWPHEPAIGHQIKFGGPYMEGDLLEIVGVVSDVKQFELDTTPMPEMYRPFSQKPGIGARTVILRAAGDPASLIAAAGQRVRELDPDLPLLRAVTMEKMLDAGLAGRRFTALLLTLFAGLAMLLAAIGIYGLLSYWVTVRQSEIALRLALGAQPGMILRWTGLHALRLAALGLAAGIAGGWAGAGLLDKLVFGIAARNAATMIAAATAVLAIALAAAAIPSWRAARVDAARKLQSA
jgi:putative ABC transport system permease protein